MNDVLESILTLIPYMTGISVEYNDECVPVLKFDTWIPNKIVKEEKDKMKENFKEEMKLRKNKENEDTLTDVCKHECDDCGAYDKDDCHYEDGKDEDEEDYKDYNLGYDEGYEDGLIDAVGISSILVNKNKKVVTVNFTDGDTQIIRCHDKDEFDMYIGVGLAIGQHIAGSKNQFHKAVNTIARVIEKQPKKDTQVKVTKSIIKKAK